MITGKTIITGSPRSILLIQLGDIGDVVLTTPCIRALREHFPQARLLVAVREKAAELLTDCPWLDRVIPVCKVKGGVVGQIGFLRTLRDQGIELAIDLRTGTRGAFLARLCGARHRIGFLSRDDDGWWRNLLFTDLINDDLLTGLPMQEHLLGLLEALAIPAVHRTPELVVSAVRQGEAAQLLAGLGPGSGPLVAVQPFSLWQYKELSREKYVALIRWLMGERQATVLVTGGPGEEARAEEIVQACGPGCHNLAGKTSLALYAALLKQCRFFLGVDSAGLHIAAAVGTRTLGIFGPSDPAIWAPQGARNRIVRKALPCVPCRNKGCEDAEISRCLQQLTVEEVLAEIGDF